MSVHVQANLALRRPAVVDKREEGPSLSYADLDKRGTDQLVHIHADTVPD